MGLLDQVLTPRGGGRKPQLSLALPLAPLEDSQTAQPAPEARMGKLKSLARLLTPRRGKQQAAPGADSSTPSPAPSGLINAYRPTLTGAIEAHVRLQSARSSRSESRLTTPPPARAPLSDSGSDTESESGSDLSSLDGFGDYARGLSPATEPAEGQGSSGPSPAAADPELP